MKKHTLKKTNWEIYAQPCTATQTISWDSRTCKRYFLLWDFFLFLHAATAVNLHCGIKHRLGIEQIIGLMEKPRADLKYTWEQSEGFILFLLKKFLLIKAKQMWMYLKCFIITLHTLIWIWAIRKHLESCGRFKPTLIALQFSECNWAFLSAVVFSTQAI